MVINCTFYPIYLWPKAYAHNADVSDAKAAEEVVNEIKAFQKGGRAIAVQADVSTTVGGQHLLDECVKAFGKLDILVLNAGIMGSKPLADTDEDFFDKHIQTNVKGPLFLTKAATSILPSRASHS